ENLETGQCETGIFGKNEAVPQMSHGVEGRLVYSFWRITKKRVKFGQLRFCEVPPFSYRQVQFDVHDTNPFQFLYFISQILTHTAYLPVEPMCKDYEERDRINLLHFTFVCDCNQNWNPVAHIVQSLRSYRLVHPYYIFISLVITCLKDFIYDVT